MNNIQKFEQTTQDAVKHPLIEPNCIHPKNKKTSLTHSGSFSVFWMYMLYKVS